jgi:hypothetical protein
VSSALAIAALADIFIPLFCRAIVATAAPASSRIASIAVPWSTDACIARAMRRGAVCRLQFPGRHRM